LKITAFLFPCNFFYSYGSPPKYALEVNMGWWYCRFSHDVTTIHTTKLLIFLTFYLNDVQGKLKTKMIHKNFCFEWILGFVIVYAWISNILRDAAFIWRPSWLKSDLFRDLLLKHSMTHELWNGFRFFVLMSHLCMQIYACIHLWLGFHKDIVKLLFILGKNLFLAHLIDKCVYWYLNTAIDRYSSTEWLGSRYRLASCFSKVNSDSLTMTLATTKS